MIPARLPAFRALKYSCRTVLWRTTRTRRERQNREVFRGFGICVPFDAALRSTRRPLPAHPGSDGRGVDDARAGLGGLERWRGWVSPPRGGIARGGTGGQPG